MHEEEGRGCQEPGQRLRGTVLGRNESARMRRIWEGWGRGPERREGAEAVRCSHEAALAEGEMTGSTAPVLTHGKD